MSLSRRMGRALAALVLGALLLALPVEASRTSVPDTGRLAIVADTSAKPDAVVSSLSPIAPTSSSLLPDAVLDETPVFGLGDLTLASAVADREPALHLGAVELLADKPPRGPPASYPETRVRGLEFSEPFRVGPSRSLILWSRQACGSISGDLVSDSPEDPWGLLGLEDVPGILADYVGSNVKSAAGTAVGLADQASGGRITGALRAYQAAQATDGSPTQRLAAAYGAYEQGKLAVTTLGFSEAPDKAAHAAELVGLRGISRGASALGEGIEAGDVDTILRGGAEAAGGIGQLAGTVAAVAAPFEKALATHTIKFDSSVISSGPLPFGGAKIVKTPLRGSGGPGKVYEIPGSELKSQKPYIGKTRQASVEKRMGNRDHRAKTATGTPPKANVLAQDLTVEEMAGVEALLIEEAGLENLTNVIPGLNTALPKNQVRVGAGRRVLSQRVE